MEKHYDFVAIGGGSAGFNGARLATKYSDRVAIIEGAPQLGGLCILRGCMPSKTLIHVAETAHHARHASRLGLEVPSVSVNMAAVRERKRHIIGEFADFRVQQMKSGKFDLLLHRARFVGSNKLELENGDTVTADRILIGTGSQVSWPDVPGLRESKPWTSDEVLELDFLPEGILVLGGGVVACEMAQYLVRMGTRVIQIQRSARILKDQSPEAAEVVETAFRDEGIELFTGTDLKRIEFDGAEYSVVFEHRGHEVTRRARHCLNALGRSPDTEGLCLGAAGVEVARSGHIVTNEFQQTANPAVYAAGDCAGPHEIVHIAIQQAEVAVKHAFKQDVEPVDFGSLLSVVFTDPQLATVGAIQPQLEKAGIPFVGASYPFDDHGKSILLESKYGYAKVLADPSYGRILGAEIVGKDAGELIHAFSIAVANKMTVWDLLRAPWYHPTLAEILTYPLEEIADQVGRP